MASGTNRLLGVNWETPRASGCSCEQGVKVIKMLARPHQPTGKLNKVEEETEWAGARRDQEDEQ